jgi:hypothetical protein
MTPPPVEVVAFVGGNHEVGVLLMTPHSPGGGGRGAERSRRGPFHSAGGVVMRPVSLHRELRVRGAGGKPVWVGELGEVGEPGTIAGDHGGVAFDLV